MKVDQANLEEYLNLFLVFLLDLGKITGTPVDPDKARSSLLKYGFANIANQHNGKSYTDSDVESLIAIAFKQTVKDFHAGVLGAG